MKKAGKRAKRPSVRDVWYVYGIVRDGFDVGRAPPPPPPGLDAGAITVLKSGSVAALVSRLPGKDYGPGVVESKSGEVAWLSPRAMAHDRVLTWAQEQGGVIPLPMFSMWGSEAALAKYLAGRASSLARVFERVSGADEFGLRVHRRDALMLESIDDVDPEMASLRREAKAASPGQRYLIERKLAEQAKTAVRAASQRMAKRIFDELSALARDAVSRALLPEAGRIADATLVLNAAFLVDRTRVDAFRAAIGSYVRDFQPRGLAFDFTGPWPPYHFVDTDRDAFPREGGAS